MHFANTAKKIAAKTASHIGSKGWARRFTARAVRRAGRDACRGY